MIQGLYVIRDEASALYLSPQVDQNNDVAVRNFDYAMAHNDMMTFRPEDFSLWYVGDYDNVTGELSPKAPQCLKRGVKRGRK